MCVEDAWLTAAEDLIGKGGARLLRLQGDAATLICREHSGAADAVTSETKHRFKRLVVVFSAKGATAPSKTLEKEGSHETKRREKKRKTESKQEEDEERFFHFFFRRRKERLLGSVERTKATPKATR